MSPDKVPDAVTLDDLATACSKVIDYIRVASNPQLEQHPWLVSACCFEIAVMGEAVKRLTPEIRAKHPEVPWRDIAGMRDRLIHGYDSIDLEELWHTATEGVPALLEQIRKIQAEELGRE